MIAVPADCPLRLGTSDEFAVIRNFFRQAEFEDANLCRVLGVGGMHDFGGVRWMEIKLELLPAPLAWCIQFFARGLPVDEEKTRIICGEKVFAALHAVGLLRFAKRNPADVVCPVWVYPADGFVMVSDRREDPEGDPFTPPADVVFPAIYPGTLRFLRLLPEARDGDALDLCGGSGIGALHCSRSAGYSATADITARSAFFAKFNARLNGIDIGNFCGDLYDAVADRQFDLISAHPPFVPTTGQAMVYRDGGETGEAVTRRIVEGLPPHLRVGGTAVVLCVACDIDNKTFEQRASEWLGEARAEFDVVFGLEKILPVEDVVESMRNRGQQIGEEVARELYARLRSAGTRQFVYGALFIRRHAERIAAEPVRVQLTSTGGAADFERLLSWRHRCRQPGFSGWLAESRPRLAPRLLLTARHVVQDGDLVPAEFVFSIEAGFASALKPDAWVVPLVARLNGKKTVCEVFEEALHADELPAGFTLEAFKGLVQRMIDLELMTVPE